MGSQVKNEYSQVKFLNINNSLLQKQFQKPCLLPSATSDSKYMNFAYELCVCLVHGMENFYWVIWGNICIKNEVKKWKIAFEHPWVVKLI